MNYDAGKQQAENDKLRIELLTKDKERLEAQLAALQEREREAVNRQGQLQSQITVLSLQRSLSVLPSDAQGGPSGSSHFRSELANVKPKPEDVKPIVGTRSRTFQPGASGQVLEIGTPCWITRKFYETIKSNTSPTQVVPYGLREADRWIPFEDGRHFRVS